MNSKQPIFAQGELTNDEVHSSLIHQRNVAYAAAALFGVIAILAVGAITVMMPLKQNVPWIIRENTVTGEFSFPERVTAENYQAIDATTVKFAYEYIKARERFKLPTMQEDIDSVYLLSSEDHAREYQDFLDNHPDSPLRLGRNDKREFALRTLIPLEEGLIQMRFTTTDIVNGQKGKPVLWIATMRYTFSPENVPSNKEDKYFNPVGFMVTDYTREPEILQEAR